MKAPFLVGICAATWFGAAGAFAGQPDTSLEASPETIACAQESGEALGQCTYSGKRDAKGKTTVTVAFANGFKRGLFFKDGKFLKGSVTMSGVGTDTDWTLEDGTHIIRVDDQRYDVPDTLVTGE